MLDLCKIIDVLILAQSPRGPTQFSWLLQLALGLPGRARAVYVLCQSLLYAQIFLDARFGSEVATFQHWGLLKDVCMFHLLCSLRVYPAYNGRLLQQTHISRSVSGEQVPAFLKINLLFWSGGVIGAERLPARIYSSQSKGAKWAAWPSLDGLGTDGWGPDLSLPLWIWITPFQIAFLLDARSHVFGSFTFPLLIGKKEPQKNLEKEIFMKSLSYSNIMCLRELAFFQGAVPLFTTLYWET